MTFLATAKRPFAAGSASSTNAIEQNVFNFGGISNPPTVYTPTIYGGNIGTLSVSLVNGAPLTPSCGILSHRSGRTDSHHLRLQSWPAARIAVQACLRYRLCRQRQPASGLCSTGIEQLPLGTDHQHEHPLHRQQRVGAILPYKGYSSIYFNGLAPTRLQRACRSG